MARFLFSLCFLTVVASTCAGALPHIVVSVAPLKSLADDLVKGMGTTTLLVQEENSGHDFRLRPSHLRQLEKADLVVWVGPSMESFLVPFAKHNPQKMLTLLELEEMTLLPQRHACHHDHAEDHDHHHHHDHDGPVDPHIWLSVNNMKHFVSTLSTYLQGRDALHQHQYKENEEALLQKLSDLQKEISDTLTPAKETPFFVFHDGYQYFEKEYNLGPSHHLLLDPEQGLSLKRLRALKEKTQETPGACLIADASLGKNRVEKMATTLDLNAVLVDPLGFGHKAKAPLSYEQMLKNLALNFQTCLSKTPSEQP